MKTAVPCYHHLDVEVSPDRVPQVRRILAARLRFWGLDNLVDTVCGGAEMLLRAIDEHARDKSTSVEMWWSGQHLITAFGGKDHVLRPDPGLRECLRHLAATCDGWGCCATGAGSRVVWFSQRARSGERVPLVCAAPGPIAREGLTVPRGFGPMAELAGTGPTVRAGGGVSGEAR
ncbi:pep a2 [Streptomyces sp. ZYX-F-203]